MFDAKAWRRKNAAKLKLSKIRWAQENKEKCRLSRLKWRKANPEKDRQAKRDYKLRNPNKDAEYYRENRAAIIARNMEWGRLNPEKRSRYGAERRLRKKESERQRHARYSRENRDKCNASLQRYRRRKQNLLHPDRDEKQINRLFSDAALLTRQTGIRHHVDHIIPLARGGWHHESNMQVLPESLNAAKRHEKFWEHPNYKCWRDVPKELWPDNYI